MAYPGLQKLKIRTGNFYLVTYREHDVVEPYILLGQLMEFYYSQNYAVSNQTRIGDGVKPMLGDATLQYAIKIAVDSNSSEFLHGFGHMTTEVYDSKSEVELDPEKGFDYKLKGYNTQTSISNAIMEHVIYITNARVRRISLKFAPGQGMILMSNGVCDEIVFQTP